MILNIVIITEKSFVQAVGNGSRKVYETARSDAEKRREQMEERREIRISESRKVRDEDGKAYGVLLETNNGDVRQLYFTTLKKNVSVTDENGKATGERAHSNTEFYKEVMKQPTLAAIFELLASKKSITVQKVDTVVTAAYREGVIVGSRTTTVPFFVSENRRAEESKDDSKKK